MSAAQNIKALADRLAAYNEWRSPDGYEHLPMPCPRAITADLREAVEVLRFVALDPGHQAIANAALREQVDEMERRFDPATKTHAFGPAPIESEGGHND